MHVIELQTNDKLQSLPSGKQPHLKSEMNYLLLILLLYLAIIICKERHIIANLLFTQ